MGTQGSTLGSGAQLEVEVTCLKSMFTVGRLQHSQHIRQAVAHDICGT
jgi:hypothetical protein